MVDILDLDECRGCRLYTGMYSFHCVMKIYASKKFVECPCRVCLIKVMCSEPCEIFSRFKDSNKQKHINKDGYGIL